jgi:hypothetical protein
MTDTMAGVANTGDAENSKNAAGVDDLDEQLVSGAETGGCG